MFFDLEAVEFFHRFYEGVEVFAGDFLDFFALAADEGVMAVVNAVVFDFATNVAFHTMDFVDEVEVFENLNNAIDRDGIEIDFVFLERDFGDLVWGK